ncbi:ComEC/Rec2 family competence protein [Paracoccus panacisoli]|uniref:ComEC/Rec2 family competence protein n=1 Tax=Paracoccus panacisoli TaxID=1510163 RepID=A0ABV6T921_9RHOB
MAALDAGLTPRQARGPRALGLRLWQALVRRKARREELAGDDTRVGQAGLIVWAPLFLSLGIGPWFALTVEPGARAYAAAGLLLLSGLGAGWAVRRAALAGRIGWARADPVWMAGLALALVAGGFLSAGLRAHLVAAPVLDFRYYGPIEGRVADIDRSARDRMRLTLDEVRLRDTAPERTPRRVRISLTEPQALPPPGTRVMLTGYLGPNPGPAEPWGFDFRRAAFFEGLGAVGYTRTPILTVAPAPPRWLDATALRLRLGAAMRDAIGGQEGAVAAALMTGDRSGIAEATNQLMRDSNLYHIVSISGLHMSMVAGFVYAALRLALAGLMASPVGRGLAGWPLHKVAALGALAAAGAYLWLSGGGVPTERAFLMVAVMLGAILLDRRALSLRTVAVAALAILAVAPEALVTPGFQMSFAATAALILVFPAWSRHADRLPWVLRVVALLVLSSLIAGLATAPLAAAHFNRSAQYGLIANLLVVTVMGAVVMPAGVIAALLAPLGLAGPALWAMGWGTRWMLGVGEMVAGWAGAVSTVSAPHWAVLPLGGTGATVALLALSAPLGRRAARGLAGVALAAVALAAGIWVGGARPTLIVAGDASAVGLMTAEGRALSKPAGAFVADSWLRADGDGASAEAAAARPGWTGPRGDRISRVGGLALHHLSGKGAAAALERACTGGAIVVMQGRAPAGRRDCVLLDEARLRETGAQAAWVREGRLTWLTTAEATGARLWTSAAVRRRAGLGGGEWEKRAEAAGRGSEARGAEAKGGMARQR